MSVHQSLLVSINTHHDTVVYKVRQIALFHLLHGLSALSINIILTCQNTLQILKKDTIHTFVVEQKASIDHETF